MEKYPKLFIKTGVYYLVLGTLMGALMGTQLISSASLRFVHIHINLLGFMAMVIMGVSYHILPRFNGKPVPFPNWIPIQFYMMNVGLLGMLTFFMLGGYWESTMGIKSIFFGLFSVLESVAIVMFAINIVSVLEIPKPVVAPPPPPQEEKEEKGGKKIPSSIPTSVPVSIPTSVPTSKPAVKIPPTPPPFPGGPGMGTGKGIKKGEMCNGEVMIGKLLETYPETRKVFAKHYGESCFTCPGQQYETVNQTADMHTMDVNIILKDINEEIEKALKGA